MKSNDDNYAKTNKLDVLSMGIAFIFNMIIKTLPTAVLLYDTFSHVRSDMHIILFDFLVGVAYMHITTTDGIVSG